MANLELSKGDTAPQITATLTDAIGPIDLTAATSVDFAMKGRTSGDLITDLAEWVDRENGKVKYTWAPDDTVAPDVYDVVWKITWSDGTTQRVPNEKKKRETITIDDSFI